MNDSEKLITGNGVSELQPSTPSSETLMTDSKRELHALHLKAAEEELSKGDRPLSEAEVVVKEAIIEQTLLEKTSGWEESSYDISHRVGDKVYREGWKMQTRNAHTNGAHYHLEFASRPDGTKTGFELEIGNEDQFPRRSGNRVNPPTLGGEHGFTLSKTRLVLDNDSRPGVVFKQREQELVPYVENVRANEALLSGERFEATGLFGSTRTIADERSYNTTDTIAKALRVVTSLPEQSQPKLAPNQAQVSKIPTFQQ